MHHCSYRHCRRLDSPPGPLFLEESAIAIRYNHCDMANLQMRGRMLAAVLAHGVGLMIGCAAPNVSQAASATSNPASPISQMGADDGRSVARELEARRYRPEQDSRQRGRPRDSIAERRPSRP